MRILRAWALRAVILLALTGPIYGEQGLVTAQEAGTAVALTGDYLGEFASGGRLFLSLVQSGATLSGFAVAAGLLPPDGAVDGLATLNASVEGTVDGNAVTLWLDLGTGSPLVMTGRKEGAILLLTTATDTGTIEELVFAPSSADEFNQVIASLEEATTAETIVRHLLPTVEDLPPNLMQSGEIIPGSMDVAVAWFGDGDEDVARLTDWGWLASVARAYEHADMSRIDEVQLLGVIVHSFRTPEGAAAALQAQATGYLTEGMDEVVWEPVGDESRFFVGPNYLHDTAASTVQLLGYKTRLYVRSGSMLIDLSGESESGDPTPILVEIAKRMLNPIYAEAQAATAAGIPAMSNSLANEIADLDWRRQWISGQVDLLARDRDDMQSAVDDLEASFADLQTEAVVTPMDCFQGDEVVFAHDNVTFEWDNVDYARFIFDLDAEELNAELSDADSAVAATRQIAGELASALNASPYPAPAMAAVPGDEEPVITAFEEEVVSAGAQFDTLQADHDAELATASAVVDQALAIFDSVQALGNC
jgi:hypothetical protein